jgi:hypothetical protein
MQFHLEKQTNIKKIPRWFAKFILRQTQNNPNIQQIFFTLLEPMTPQKWCLIWIPIYVQRCSVALASRRVGAA